MVTGKIIHDETLEGSMHVNVRIATKMEGEDESRIFDLEGEGLLGVVINQGEGVMEGQSFAVGVTATSTLRGLEVMINMIIEKLGQEDLGIPKELALIALSTMLLSKADSIMDQVMSS